MTTDTKTPAREPVANAYGTSAIYQVPSDGTVKHATIVHAYSKNYTDSKASLTIASVNNTGTTPVPGTDESSTNEYYQYNLPAKTGEVMHDMIGKRLLPGEFINDKSDTANAIISEYSIIEELN